MADGRVEFEITADGRRAFASIDQVTDALKKSGVKWEQDAKSSTDSIGSGFEGMLKKVSAAFSAATIGKAILDWGKAAVEAASDLEEVQNVVDVTFGESSAKIESWAKKAGDQFGLTETQAKRFTSTLGAMMKSAGMSGNQIADISTDLAGLAADMASFYNLDFDTAFNKIRSGLSGETEPLKQLGINMSTANLEAFALQQGLNKTFAQMTQGEQTMLRYQYIMQATADAQGDFARTSDGFANSQRRMQTAIDTLKAKMGAPLLGVIADATGALADFIGKLTEEPGRTVLDEFDDIDKKTVSRLTEIEAKAEEARTLTGVLEEIGSKADEGRSKIAGITDDAPDGSKLGGVTEGLAGISQQSGKTGEELKNNLEVLEEIRSKAGEGQEKIAGITDKAPDGSKLNGVKNSLAGISEQGVKTGEDLQKGLEPLEGATETITSDNELWLETCQRLTSVLPGLKEIINAETGEIRGGTQAIRDYIDAWEQGQKGIVLRSAHEQKRTALDTKFAELPELELDMTVAEYRARKVRDRIQEIYDKYGINPTDAATFGGFKLMTPEETQELREQVDVLNDLEAKAQEARDAYDEQKAAYDEAVSAYEDEGRAIEETYGNAIEASREWSEETKQAARDAVNAVEEILQEIEDYTAQVRESTLQQIEGTVKGFEEIVLPSEARRRVKELTEELNGLDTSAKDSAERIREINREINSLGGEKVTASGMLAGLKSQVEYMDEYLANMDKIRSKGILADELLASLSDGSVESADYLAALAEATDTELEEINKQWQAVQEGKQKMADGLTDQKLTVDQTYQAMVERARETVKQLDLGQEATEATGNTVKGLAKGIADHVPDVKDQVDRIIAQLDRLNGYGIDIDFGQFGSVSFETKTHRNEAMPHRSGISTVPFNGYLAELHQGEAVLTEQENAIWQRYKTGLRDAVDYDQLGGMMREIKPGGDVYLDGRIVGRVMSAMQGNQYRTLERSGWQSGR